MIGYIYDDFLHVGLSCDHFIIKPQDRFLINYINCAIGPSVEGTRTLSFILLFFIVYLSLKLFSPDSSWKKILSNTFFISFNCIILFPVIYASQFSTVITTLWAFGLTYFTFVNFPKNKIFYIIICFFILIIGCTLRYESILYFAIISTVFYLFQYYFNNKKINNFLLKIILTVVAYVILLSIYQYIFNSLLEKTNVYVNTYASLTEGSYYPHFNYIISQIYSIFLYTAGYIYPFNFTFWGPWADFWVIQKSTFLTILLPILFFSFLSILFYIFYKHKKNKIIYSLCVFLLCTFVLSLPNRNDWYYPSRAFIGTLLALTIIATSISNRKIFVYLIMYQFIGVVFQYQFHYKDNESFTFFELEKNHHKTPLAHINSGNYYADKGNIELAKIEYYNAYKSVPTYSLNLSSNAHYLWAQSLFNAYQLCKKHNLEQDSSQIIATLMASDIGLSTYACIQNDELNFTRCLEGKRKVKFCEFLFSHKGMAIAQEFPLKKIEAAKLCY